MPTIFQSPQDLLDHIGKPLGSSEWLLIDQARINLFADATGDHQWIHVDPERARTGPFGATIAHGYLTLALVNLFLPQIIDVRGISMGVNVGSDRLRFLTPVRVGSHIRGKGELIAAVPIASGAVQAIVRVSVELKDNERPACVVDTISRYYPEKESTSF
jgi:acyl dehydratase